MSRLRSVLANLALSALSIGIVFGGAELFRWREPAARPVASYITDWQDWDGDFYTVKSTAVGWPPWEDYNTDGLRDREHALEKPPGVRRIACLGDSTTLGWGIRPEEAYPQVLQDRLDALGRRVEVFNVALGGWSTRQERIAWRRIARRYKPDQALLGVCLNDLPELQNNLSRPAPWLATLYRRSALVRGLLGARQREIGDVEELFTKRETPRVREAFARFFTELVGLRDEVKQDGASLSVLIFPFRLQLAADAPAASAQQEIAAFCAAQKIPVLDMLPALRAVGNDGFIDYDHFSPTGAQAVADQVVDAGIVGDAEGAPPTSPVVASGADVTTRVSDLITALQSKDDIKRMAAARALGNLGIAAALAAGPLENALADSSADMRAAAAWALGGLADAAQHAQPALIKALTDPAPAVRAGAAWALGHQGAAAQAAAPSLVAALADAAEPVRWRAGEALGRIGCGVEALPALRRVLDDAQGPGRSHAAWALGRMGAIARDAVPSLVQALDDPREEVRSKAAWALGEIGPDARSAVPSLVRALDDAGIRWLVADALGGIGPDAAAAVAPLSAALADTSSNVRWRSAKALGRIGPTARPAVPQLVIAASDSQENVRLAALHALGQVGALAGDARPAFIRALHDTDPRARREAVDGLGRLEPPDQATSGLLVPALADEDAGVRVAAARALGRLSPLAAEAQKALQAASHDTDEKVREAAVRALARQSVPRGERDPGQTP